MTDTPAIVEDDIPGPKGPGYEVSIDEAAFSFKTIVAISKTEFVPKGLRGRPEAILACVLAGREIGLPPMESLRSIDIIDGKVSPSAELMLNLIRQAGHRVEVIEWDDKHCKLKGSRYYVANDASPWDGGETMVVEFTEAMMKRAGLASKSNWKSYPEAMYYWRAIGMLARTLFADVISALKYLPEELGSDTWTAAPPEVPDDFEPAVSEGVIIDIDPEEPEADPHGFADMDTD